MEFCPKTTKFFYNAWKARDRRTCFRGMKGASTYCSRKAAKLAKKNKEMFAQKSSRLRAFA